MIADLPRYARHPSWLLAAALAATAGGCQVMAPADPVPAPPPEAPTALPEAAPPEPAPPPPVLDPGPATVGPGGPGLFDGRVGQAVPRATYSVLGIPSQPVEGQPTRLGLLRQDLTLGSPLWQADGDEWTFNAHVHSELFDTGAVLPGTGRPFPDSLWDVRLGTTFRHLFDNGWVAGGTVSVGSASDKPFHSINEMTAGVNAFLRVPQGEHNAWLFSLSYSPTAQLSFPIPMVAFLYQPSPDFRVNIGLPFQLMYRPTEDLTLDLSYMLLTTIHAQATYRITPQLRLHAGFDWSNESFFLADRTDTQARFFSYEKRLSVGVLYAFSPRATLDLSAGYVFDRFYFEGRQLSDSQNDRVNVGDSAFVALRFMSKW
jgi:hypothetical protein